MSSLKRSLFGEKSTPAQAVNMTPQAYQQLAGPLAAQFQQMLANPAQWQGGYAAPIGAGEQAALGGVAGAAGQVGQGGYGQQALMQQAGGQMNPYAGLSGLEAFGLGQVANRAYGPNPGVSQANAFLGQQLGGVMNPFAQAAGLTGGEQLGLNSIQQQAFAQNPQLAQFLGQQLGGQMNPYAQLSAGEQTGLNAIQQTAFGQSPLQGGVNAQLQQLIGGGQNPYAQQLMDAAVRPILQNFDEQALAERGLYTGAGQQIQRQGSSPFAQASARLSGNVANAIGDTTAKLGAQLFDSQQQAQLAALGMAQAQPGLQLQNQLAATQALGLPRELQSQAFQQMVGNQFGAAGLADQTAGNAFQRALAGTQALGLGREVSQLGLDRAAGAYGQMQQNQFNAAGLADQFSGNALQRALAGLDAAGTGQERQGAAFESAANRQLQAGSALGNLNLQQQVQGLQGQLANLEAQGLPRLVQQLGIEGGLNQFNQQQGQLMNLLQLMGQLSSPSTTIIPGQQGSTGALGALAGGLGQGFGSAIGTGLGGLILSDRRLKRDIQQAGVTPNGTKVYRFKYVGSDDTHIGVMADEVQHIPGAAVRMHGFDYVDLNKVAAHG